MKNVVCRIEPVLCTGSASKVQIPYRAKITDIPSRPTAKFVIFNRILSEIMAKLTREDLLDLFQTVKKELQKYEKGSLKARGNPTQPAADKYDLWSEKDLIDPIGKPRKEINFASLVVQSNYLGFYYMPIYCNPKLGEKIAPELMKLLKGKACFHIKSLSPEMLSHIRDALKLGYDGYRGLGWVD